MVVAEEGFELHGHMYYGHDGEVVLVVPAPGDLPVGCLFSSVRNGKLGEKERVIMSLAAFGFA